MLNTMTAMPSLVFENSKVASLPLNGKSISIMEMTINAVIALPIKPNQHGLTYMVMATDSLKVELHRILDGERSVLTTSQSRFTAFSKQEDTFEEVENPSYELVITNNSPRRVKVSTVVT